MIIDLPKFDADLVCIRPKNKFVRMVKKHVARIVGEGERKYV
jgi:hypothetical protein